jgi:hypothetical protein
MFCEETNDDPSLHFFLSNLPHEHMSFVSVSGLPVCVGGGARVPGQCEHLEHAIGEPAGLVVLLMHFSIEA